MDFDNITPEDQSYHTLQISRKKVQVKFRYFSPSKLYQITPQKQQKIQNKQDNSQQIQSSSSIAKQKINIIKQQFDIRRSDLVNQSHSFFRYQIHQITGSTLDYYQKFQQKLIDKALQPKKSVIKLKLTQNNSSSESRLKKSQIKSFIKRVHINLTFKNKDSKQNASTQKRKSIMQTVKRGIHQQNLLQQKLTSNLKRKKMNLTKEKPKQQNQHLVIRLYEKNAQNQKSKITLKKNFQEQLTPRRSSASQKKGITVYSSSARKTSIQQNKKDENLVCIHNISTNNQQKQDNRVFDRLTANSASRKKCMCSYMSQPQGNNSENISRIKQRVQATKRRVFSKSRLTRKTNPSQKKYISHIKKSAN